MQKYARIRGRITTQKSRQPVHGLHIEARSERSGKTPALTTTISTADGAFELHWPADTAAMTSVELIITDRDGHLVSTRRTRPHPADTASRATNLRIPDDDLANHLARPTTWTDTGQRLFSPHVEAGIRHAIGLIAPIGSPGFDQLIGHILCPGPLLPAFDDLIHTGWDVLTGDPAPLVRFRDAIQTLETVDARASRQLTRKTAAAWSRLVCDEGVAHLRALGRKGVATTPAFGPDVLIPLLLPAGIASAGRPEVFAGHLGLVLRQLDAARHVHTLHGAAQRALGGDPEHLRHFEGMLDLFGALCGPDDGPVLVPDENFRPYDEVADPACLADLIDHHLHDVSIYAIYSIDPVRACEDEIITIIGYGFDFVPELVKFGRWGVPGAWIEVTPESWSNEQITVRVPADAGCGLRLALPPKAAPACGRYVDAWPSDSGGALFDGGAAQVLFLSVNGNIDTFTVMPHDTLEVTWRTCAADDIHIEIIIVEDGSVPYEHITSDREGTWEQQLWDCNSTTELRVRITATGSCPPLQAVRDIAVFIHHLPALTVHGIEVTQAIQYYRADEHLTDPADQRPDNAIQLIAGKTGYVRVYLRSGLEDEEFDDGILHDIAGWLTLDRIVDGEAEFVDQYLPRNADPVDARWGFDDYDDERGDLDMSINFLIPAEEMRGRLRLTVNVDVSNPAEAPCGGGSAEQIIEVDVDLDQTLNYVLIPVGYEGPPFNDPSSDTTITIAAPTETQFVNRLDYTLKTFPINEDPDIRTLEAIDIDFPLNGDRMGDGGCSKAWYDFLAFTLLPAKIGDGNEASAVYLGILPSALPKNPGGCATFGVTGLDVTRRVTIAHETGHILGRPHAPRGAVGNFDTEYPAYEPYDEDDTPNASLGEYGLDTVNESLREPSRADLMSYGSDRWISLHTYNKLIQPDGGWLSPTAVPAGGQGGASGDRDQARGAEPCIVLTALIDADGELEVGHVSRCTTRRVLTGRRTRYEVQLLDEKDNVITASALYADEPVGCPCRCADCRRDASTRHGAAGGKDDGIASGEPLVTAVALLPDRAPGAALRIRHGKKIVWERKAAPRRPRIRLREASISARGKLSLRWEASVYGEHAPSVTLRWSQNRRDWRMLSQSLKGSRATLDIRRLPPGRVYFELLLHDGLHSARAGSKALTVPAGAPVLGILHPVADEPVTAGRPLRLWARARSASGAPLPDTQISWRVDGKRAGEGRSVWIEAPPAGRHEVSCTATAGRRRSQVKGALITR